MVKYIDVKVRLYLEDEVSEEEADYIVQEMDYSFDDLHIRNTEILDYETNPSHDSFQEGG